MKFYNMRSIDEIPLNLDHVRTLTEGCIFGDGGVSVHLIRATFSNGDTQVYRYESQEDRDDVMWMFRHKAGTGEEI